MKKSVSVLAVAGIITETMKIILEDGVEGSIKDMVDLCEFYRDELGDIYFDSGFGEKYSGIIHIAGNPKKNLKKLKAALKYIRNA